MKWTFKVGVTLSYFFMMTLNTLANLLPINGITTGEVSDNYNNFFAPAGYTFAIWGVIYFLLALYVLRIWLNKIDGHAHEIAGFFMISSFANGLWMLAWHFDYIGVSLILMLVILICLIKIAYLTKPGDRIQNIIFHVYFGWITVATIANITTFFVKLDYAYAFLSIPHYYLFMVVIFTGVTIAFFTALKFKSLAYMTVIFWSYIGILVKILNLFPSSQRNLMTVGLIVCIAVIFGTCAYLAYETLNRQQKMAS
ncbi:MAG: tryptophan-rich sensory protein [Acholeplasmataceae bacterium]|nr:tryptophan-rich sensory protein [Acholeplasmataceae bacterium]